VKIAVSGAGAAAIACLDLMVGLGVRRENVFVCDSKGLIHTERTDKLDDSKRRYAQPTNGRTLADAVNGADVFLGCSAAGTLTAEMVKTMGTQPIILALANPEPEIRPELARIHRRGLRQVPGGSLSENGSRNKAAVPRRSATMSQPVRAVLPPRREMRMNPAQITTVVKAAT